MRQLFMYCVFADRSIPEVACARLKWSFVSEQDKEEWRLQRGQAYQPSLPSEVSLMPPSKKPGTCNWRTSTADSKSLLHPLKPPSSAEPVATQAGFLGGPATVTQANEGYKEGGGHVTNRGYASPNNCSPQQRLCSP
jgi:hypothetical protein